MSSHLACPNCGVHLELDAEIACPDCGPIGIWRPEERRIEWQIPGMDDFLLKRVMSERAEWDSWADRSGPPPREPPSSQWFASTRTMRAAAASAPGFAAFEGKRMLDVGSTCRHSVKFLKEGLMELDQIEVSPASQRHALARLIQEEIDLRKVMFHTSPAENLPFADSSFDLVFSSGTIHHTFRDRSLPEVHRVLKPGGEFLFIESSLPEHLYALMKVTRGLKHADRGTDDPLHSRDFKMLRRLFQDVRVYRFNILWFLWRVVVSTSWGARKRHDILALDEKVGDGFGLGHLLGTQCWVSGRKLGR